jgi:two-component system chemotaxis response regulator CheY
MAKKVVLVDDSAAVLMIADEALEDLVEAGVIEFTTYDNPENVLSDVKNGMVFDLLITDINMPQMTGFDLISQIKRIPAVKAKPTIALTTENSPDMKSQGKKVGLVGWLTKPFSDDKLQMSIKRVLRIK